MGFSRRFPARLLASVALLLGAVLASAWLLTARGAPTAALIAGGMAAAAGVAVWRLVNESNVEMARFVAALERGDTSQSFGQRARGAGHDRVSAAYEAALARLRAERVAGARADRFAEALIDSAPVPLLVIDEDGQVAFANKASRRLFGRAAPTTLDALERFGTSFATAAREAAPGPARLATLATDDLAQRVTLDTTLLESDGVTRRIVAVRVIQTELDRAELSAQVDLVRVLTHEIMNSLTPVISLAETAMRAVAPLDPALSPHVADARLATEALARRAAELGRFIATYKGFSEVPAMTRDTIEVAGWLAEVMQLFAATPQGAAVRPSLAVARGLPPLRGDAALLTQVMLNLLKNAGEAAAAAPPPAGVSVTASALADGRLRITVADSGPGIPPHLARDVFLPFFTTKADGSGIGLSIARQVVLLHGGHIAVSGSGDLEILL